MSTDKNQSDIKEVREQLFLDTADGEYLNVVTSNLGLSRPVLGFTDDVWRALVKVLAVQYKQITTKFHAVLSELYGPQYTQTSSLDASSAAGDTTLDLTGSELVPQQGTVVLDEGLASEETIEYCFVDRTNDLMYLGAATQFAHTAREYVELPIRAYSPTSNKLVFLREGPLFEDVSLPFTLVVGRGTEREEVAEVASLDPTTNTVFLAAPLTNTPRTLEPTVVQSLVASQYSGANHFLSLQDTSQFSDSGYIAVHNPSGWSPTSGGPGHLTVAASTFVPDTLVGYRVRFTGGALAGVTADIVENTDNDLFFAEFLPAAPGPGTPFTLIPIYYFSGNDRDSNELILPYPARDTNIQFFVGATTYAEEWKPEDTAATGTVQIKGAGWDVYETGDKEVTIVLPESLQEPGTLRSVSPVHGGETANLTTPFGTTTAVTAGDTLITFQADIPTPYLGASAVVILSDGATFSDQYHYTRYTFEDTLDLPGSTRETLSVNTGGHVASSLIDVPLTIGDNLFHATVTANTLTTITVQPPVPDSVWAALEDGEDVFYWTGRELVLNTPAVSSYSAGTLSLLSDLELLDQYGGSTNYMFSGDFIDPENVPAFPLAVSLKLYPGPYVYDAVTDVPVRPAVQDNAAVMNSILSGPVKVMVDQDVSRTCLELENAIYMPRSGFPVNASLGAGTGNYEPIVINALALKDRTATTFSAGTLAGVTSLPVTALSSAAANSTFPDEATYRLLLSKGTVREEVVLVTGTDGAGPTISCSACVNAHNITDTVELIADVISVNALIDFHEGVVSNSALPSNEHILAPKPRFSSGDYISAETVSVLYDEVTITNGSNFQTDGGTVILNYGNADLSAAGTISGALTAGVSTTITLSIVGSPFLPAVGIDFVLILSPGTSTEEHLVGTLSGTTFTLETNTTVKYSHATSTPYVFHRGEQDVFTYSASTATTLSFSPPIVVQSTHQSGEFAGESTARSTSAIDGTGYPFRMPSDLFTKPQLLLDLVRAAGHQVLFVSDR